ncbi:MAG: DegT/DnrJ/EryC1/StrS family aminotransferase [Lachnospiraceae bacterium]
MTETKQIPLMNLTRQYKSLEKDLDSAALRVLHSGQYIMGEEVSEFEKEFAAYCGTKYAVGVGNGTDALMIALMAAGVGNGDEVITSAMSFFATAEAIAVVGATPVFVDCQKENGMIDVEAIEEKISPKTKAIIPVHLYGQCADMDKINEIARKHNLIVIEDAAQAAGAEYKGKKAGSLGDIGCFSFFPTKNLGCAGDGGIITTNNETVYKCCMAYRVHGSGINGLLAYGEEKGIAVSEEDVDFQGNLPKYYNFVIGHNSRLDALQAALLRIKLPQLDEWNEKRRRIASVYEEKIQNPHIEKMKCGADKKHIYYVYVLEVDNREKFRDYMKENGIATGVYFPVPLHLQRVFENLGYTKGDMPNAEYLAEHGVAIPMFAELTDIEVDRIIQTVNDWK